MGLSSSSRLRRMLIHPLLRGERLGHFRHAQAVQGQQVGHELRLFQQRERMMLRPSQQLDNARWLLPQPRDT